jgi:2-aminobenzoate-CoA ligase
MATMETHVPAEPTAHLDTFARDHLPPRELWPVMDYGGLPELAYPPRLNCAVELLDRMADAGHADRPAILWDGGRWRYRELAETSNRIAAVLRDDLGLVPGNRVLLRGPNSPMMAACWFGVLKAGGIVVATMPLLRARELATVAEKAQVHLALTDHRLAADLEEARGMAPVLERIVQWGSEDEGSLDRLMSSKPAEFEAVDTAADDVALIAFTSGTTGKPKGAMHFHRDVLACCDTFSRHVLQPSADDVFTGSPPLAFTFGLGGLLLFPMRTGAATLLVEQPTPPNLLKAIQDHRVTVCFTAPVAYRAMAEQAASFDLSSLRKCVSAGETLPLPTFEAFERATGIKIIDGIGSTEMLHIFIASSGGDIRPGSTGKAVPGYRARVIGENGDPLPPGSIGRLAVQGPTGCR